MESSLADDTIPNSLSNITPSSSDITIPLQSDSRTDLTINFIPVRISPKSINLNVSDEFKIPMYQNRSYISMVPLLGTIKGRTDCHQFCSKTLFNKTKNKKKPNWQSDEQSVDSSDNINESNDVIDQNIKNEISSIISISSIEYKDLTSQAENNHKSSKDSKNEVRFSLKKELIPLKLKQKSHDNSDVKSITINTESILEHSNNSSVSLKNSVLEDLNVSYVSLTQKNSNISIKPIVDELLSQHEDLNNLKMENSFEITINDIQSMEPIIERQDIPVKEQPILQSSNKRQCSACKNAATKADSQDLSSKNKINKQDINLYPFFLQTRSLIPIIDTGEGSSAQNQNSQIVTNSILDDKSIRKMSYTKKCCLLETGRDFSFERQQIHQMFSQKCLPKIACTNKKNNQTKIFTANQDYLVEKDDSPKTNYSNSFSGSSKTEISAKGSYCNDYAVQKNILLENSLSVLGVHPLYKNTISSISHSKNSSKCQYYRFNTPENQKIISNTYQYNCLNKILEKQEYCVRKCSTEAHNELPVKNIQKENNPSLLKNKHKKPSSQNSEYDVCQYFCTDVPISTSSGKDISNNQDSPKTGSCRYYKLCVKKIGKNENTLKYSSEGTETKSSLPNQDQESVDCLDISEHEIPIVTSACELCCRDIDLMSMSSSTESRKVKSNKYKSTQTRNHNEYSEKTLNESCSDEEMQRIDKNNVRKKSLASSKLNPIKDSKDRHYSESKSKNSVENVFVDDCTSISRQKFLCNDYTRKKRQLSNPNQKINARQLSEGNAPFENQDSQKTDICEHFYEVHSRSISSIDLEKHTFNKKRQKINQKLCPETCENHPKNKSSIRKVDKSNSSHKSFSENESRKTSGGENTNSEEYSDKNQRKIQLSALENNANGKSNKHEFKRKSTDSSLKNPDSRRGSRLSPRHESPCDNFCESEKQLASTTIRNKSIASENENKSKSSSDKSSDRDAKNLPTSIKKSNKNDSRRKYSAETETNLRNSVNKNRQENTNRKSDTLMQESIASKHDPGLVDQDSQGTGRLNHHSTCGNWCEDFCESISSTESVKDISPENQNIHKISDAENSKGSSFEIDKINRNYSLTIRKNEIGKTKSEIDECDQCCIDDYNVPSDQVNQKPNLNESETVNSKNDNVRKSKDKSHKHREARKDSKERDFLRKNKKETTSVEESDQKQKSDQTYCQGNCSTQIIILQQNEESCTNGKSSGSRNNSCKNDFNIQNKNKYICNKESKSIASFDNEDSCECIKMEPKHDFPRPSKGENERQTCEKVCEPFNRTCLKTRTDELQEINSVQTSCDTRSKIDETKYPYLTSEPIRSDIVESTSKCSEISLYIHTGNKTDFERKVFYGDRSFLDNPGKYFITHCKPDSDSDKLPTNMDGIEEHCRKCFRKNIEKICMEDDLVCRDKSKPDCQVDICMQEDVCGNKTKPDCQKDIKEEFDSDTDTKNETFFCCHFRKKQNKTV